MVDVLHGGLDVDDVVDHALDIADDAVGEVGERDRFDDRTSEADLLTGRAPRIPVAYKIENVLAFIDLGMDSQRPALVHSGLLVDLLAGRVAHDLSILACLAAMHSSHAWTLRVGRPAVGRLLALGTITGWPQSSSRIQRRGSSGDCLTLMTRLTEKNLGLERNAGPGLAKPSRALPGIARRSTALPTAASRC